MNKFEKILSLAIVLSLFGIGLLLFKGENGLITGSVSPIGVYKSTVTRNHAGTAITNLSVLGTGSCTLGSVIITGAGAGVINIYDATSTVTNAEWATTTLATIPANAAAGTYTFDISAYKGILIETVGVVGTSTISYRCS